MFDLFMGRLTENCSSPQIALVVFSFRAASPFDIRFDEVRHGLNGLS